MSDIINPTRIVRVYSGRLGCACGCRGKYTNSSLAPDADGTPVNDAVVRRIVATMNTLGPKLDGDLYHVETPTRQYIAYLGAEPVAPKPAPVLSGDQATTVLLMIEEVRRTAYNAGYWSNADTDRPDYDAGESAAALRDANAATEAVADWFAANADCTTALDPNPRHLRRLNTAPASWYSVRDFVMRDPAEKHASVWRVVWDDIICTPVFNSEGAAAACLDMYRHGRRKPELPAGYVARTNANQPNTETPTHA